MSRISTWPAKARRRHGTALLLAVTLAAATVAFGHGASKGLHLHLSPDPASAGATITVELSAAEPVRHVRVGFVDADPIEAEIDPPRKDVELTLEVPAGTKHATINCQAEARTETGSTLRASAVLRIARP